LDDLIRNPLWQQDRVYNRMISPDYGKSGRVFFPDVKELPADGTAKL